MQTRLFHIGLAFGIAGSLSSVLTDAATYTIALSEIPAETDLLKQNTQMSSLIMSLVSEPLFTSNEDGSLSSMVLDVEKSKAVDISFRNFELCLQKDSKFADGTEVKALDLKNVLKEEHEKNPKVMGRAEFSIKDRCVNVALDDRNPYYFQLLVVPQSGPRKVGIDGKIIGTGAFIIERYSTDEVVLRTVPTRKRGDIDSVTIVRFDGKPGFKFQDVDDWNSCGAKTAHVKEIVEKQIPVRRPTRTLLAVILGISDSATRIRMAHCLTDIQNDFVSIIGKPEEDRLFRGYLPTGMFGSISSAETPRSAKHDSAYCKRRNSCVISLLSYNRDEDRALETVILSNKHRLPCQVNIKKIAAKDLVKELSVSQNSMAVVANTSSALAGYGFTASLQFFDGLYGNNPLVPGGVSGLAKILGEATKADLLAEKERLIMKADQLVLDSGVISPLFIRHRVLRFSPRFEPPEFLNRFSNFPRFELLKLKRK